VTWENGYWNDWVNYTTENYTAYAGVDYTETSGQLAFAPGETSKSFNVPILNNSNSTGRQFIVQLTETNQTFGSPRSAMVTFVEQLFGSLTTEPVYTMLWAALLGSLALFIYMVRKSAWWAGFSMGVAAFLAYILQGIAVSGYVVWTPSGGTIVTDGGLANLLGYGWIVCGLVCAFAIIAALRGMGGGRGRGRDNDNGWGGGNGDGSYTIRRDKSRYRR